MFDITDLRSTIVPKSDQLNAEQLLTGDMTVTVSDVGLGSDDQPVIIHYISDDGRPYKPCKTMRKVLIFAWGEDGRKWVGRSMTLYCDQTVKFGGMNVGGIRISHLSDIQREIAISLTATRGKKAPHTIKVLKVAPAIKAPALIDVLVKIDSADTLTALADAGKLAALLADKDKPNAKAAYKARMLELKTPAFDAAAFIARVQEVNDVATLQLFCDDAEMLPQGEDRDSVMQALLQRDQELAAA